MNLPALPTAASPEEAASWLGRAVESIGLCFHVDTPAADYVNAADQPLFSASAGRSFDDSLSRAVELLEAQGRDVYEECFAVLQALWRNTHGVAPGDET